MKSKANSTKSAKCCGNILQASVWCWENMQNNFHGHGVLPAEIGKSLVEIFLRTNYIMQREKMRLLGIKKKYTDA